MTMLVYPQLATGALCQFPLRKSRQTRTVTNRAADGSTIKLSDPAAEITKWELQYSELSDAEAAALRDFFAATEGTLNGFTFLDPAGNLLASTDQLDAQAWQRDPMLTVTGAAADPLGGTRAWQLTNSGGAAQALAQTLAVPGIYQYCLSAYVQSATPGTVGLIVGGQTVQQAVGAKWGHAVLVRTGAADAESMRFGIEVSAGAMVHLYGLQVEPQGGASGYRVTTRGGVYVDAHLGSDQLNVVDTGVNRHSCTVSVIHANHI